MSVLPLLLPVRVALAFFATTWAPLAGSLPTLKQSKLDKPLTIKLGICPGFFYGGGPPPSPLLPTLYRLSNKYLRTWAFGRAVYGTLKLFQKNPRFEICPKIFPLLKTIYNKTKGELI